MAARKRKPSWAMNPTIGMAFASVSGDDERARIIDASNKVVRWCTIHEAVTSGESFFVPVPKDVVAIDCDDGAVDNAFEMLEFIEKLGESPVIASSGRPNHFHVLTRFKNLSLLDRVKDEARRRGHEVKTGIRPIGSIHRNGVDKSRLLWPTDFSEALARLMPPTSQASKLSGPYQVLLRYGDIGNLYPHKFERRSDRSTIVLAIAANAVRQGMDFETLLRLFLDPQNVGGEKVREHECQRRDGRGYVERIWRSALAPSTDPTGAYGKRAIRFITAAETGATIKLAGMNGSANVVFAAHIAIAMRCKRVRYTASVRELAEHCGLAPRTVMKYNDQLVKTGLIGIVPRCSATSEWHIVCNRATVSGVHPPKNKVNVVLLHTRSSHDAFRRGALGKNGILVYQAIIEGHTDRRSIQKRCTGIHRTTVERNLKRLLDVGVVVDTGAGLVVNEGVSLDEVAEMFSTAGQGARQRQRHERQRQAYEDRTNSEISTKTKRW